MLSKKTTVNESSKNSLNERTYIYIDNYRISCNVAFYIKYNINLSSVQDT